MRRKTIGGPSMYVLDDIENRYHTQRNNKLFPYRVCGTTVVANTLSHLGHKDKKFYVHDDDSVFESLHDDEMIRKAMAYIQEGEKWIHHYLNDKRYMDGKETEYNHLNNVMIMLAEVGSYLTNYDYVFKMKYRSMEEILEALYDDEVPIIMSGDFTKSGHYVLIVGENLRENGSLVFHDPYGNWNTGYKDHNGNCVEYTMKDLMEKAFKKPYRMYWNADRSEYYILTVKPVKTR